MNSLKIKIRLGLMMISNDQKKEKSKTINIRKYDIDEMYDFVNKKTTFRLNYDNNICTDLITLLINMYYKFH